MSGAKKLELYIHIPFCQRKCRYCDFLSFDKRTDMEGAYVAALKKQIAFYADLYGERPVSSVYIGGGTPSWIHRDNILEICELLTGRFNIEADAEITMEVNPGTVSKEKAESYKAAGINRISIGLQSANDEELKLLGRIHDYPQFLNTLDIFLKQGFDNINIDIMTGLPYQTPEKLLATLRQVLLFRPKHISAYSLIVEEGTLFYEEYGKDRDRQKRGEPTEALPDEDAEYALSELVRSVLADNNYEQYEISNFSRKGYRCRHNIGYWDRTEYVGIGLGAASLVNETRFSVTRDLDEYIKKMAEGDYNGALCDVRILSRNEQMSEFMFLGLRMLEGVSAFEFQKNFGTSANAVYGAVLRKLENDGLLLTDDGRIRLTKRGLDLGNMCMAQFLL